MQPLVFSMFRDATRTVKLLAAALGTAVFDAKRLESRAADGWTTLTELADTLTRDHGLPFRTAHAIAARLCLRTAGGLSSPDRPLSAVLADASAEVLGAPLTYSEAQLSAILSPRHFVEIRRTFGGPAPEETARAAGASHATLVADREWWGQMTDALERCRDDCLPRGRLLSRGWRLEARGWG